MIYSKRNEQLWAVYQTDHADVCGRMAEAWGRPPFRPPDRLEAVVLGAAMHDEGWRVWEQRPKISENGTPLGFFELSVADHLTIHRRGAKQVAAEHEEAGVLVSMHASGLYRGRFGLESERRYDPRFNEHRGIMSIFLAEQEQLQKRISQRIGWPLWQRLEAYLLLQFWDRLSLLFCMHAKAGPIQMNGVPADGGPTEVTVGLENGTVILDPFPFVEEFQVEVPVRILDQFEFRDDEELGTALRAAEAEVLRIRLVGH